MPTRTYETHVDVPAAALFDWHARPGAFQRLAPPWAPVSLESSEGIEEGDRAVLRLGVGPFALRWVAEHRDYEAGRQFRDVQVRGPFRAWEHLHRIDPVGEGTSRLRDELRYEPPLGDLGARVAGGLLEDELDRQFAYRHRVTRTDPVVHARAGLPPLRIAISGASGLLGSSLVPFLTTGGHEILRLVRSGPSDDPARIYWNHRTGEIERAKLEGVDAVIHLAGENVFAPRWTEEKKTRILASREAGTSLLAETLAGLDRPPKTFVSVSAIGYYGDTGTTAVTEEAPPGETGFLALVSRAWEGAADPARAAGIRTVHPRIGVVLTPRGGALGIMHTPFRLGLGGSVGGDDLYVSWIALDDLLYAFLHLLADDGLEGPVNLTAPTPVPMPVLTRTLARVLGRPHLFHIPAALVRALGGEAAEQTMLASLRVEPARLLERGFEFAYPDLDAALRHVLGR